MDKLKGGRGKTAPYDTKLMRVPVGLEEQVQELIERYRHWVFNGNTIVGTDNPPRLLDAAVTNKPVNNLPELEELRSQLEQAQGEANACLDSATQWQAISEQAHSLLDGLKGENSQLKSELEQLRSQLEQVEQEANKPVNEFEGEQPDRNLQPDKPVNEFNGKPMRLRQLTNFLGQKSHSYISKIKSEPNFEQWSRERDPHGVAWRYDPESKLFYPVP